MLKGVLLFLAGLLVGANLVYFVMAREPGAGTRAPGDGAVVPAEAMPAQPAMRAVAPQAVEAQTAQPPPAALPTTTPAPLPPAPATAPTGALQMPVVGMRADQIGDTYNDIRGGDTRIHEALDIMAPRGTPVVAAVDGKVEKLFTSKAGGLTVYQFDRASTYAYYYAHLDSYAPSLHEGQLLKRGDPIGFVGSTGNASPDAPHLHFAIFLLGPDKHWWEGTPVNPYPLLAHR